MIVILSRWDELNLHGFISFFTQVLNIYKLLRKLLPYGKHSRLFVFWISNIDLSYLAFHNFKEPLKLAVTKLKSK